MPNILSRLVDRIKGAEIGGWNILPWQNNRPYQSGQLNSSILPWNALKKYRKPATDVELIERYQSWVFACANKNAISVAQVPLRLYAAKPEKGMKNLFPVRKVEAGRLGYLKRSASVSKFISMAVEVEEIVEHPFLDLLSKVNQFMNGFELLELAVTHQELVGNAYWFILKGDIGVPTEIWPLYPQFVKPVVDEKKFIKGYLFTISGQKKIFIDPEFIIHFKYPNPKDPIMGMGKLEGCVVAADLSFNMNAYEAALFENNAIPDVVFILPADAGAPSEPEVSRLKREWHKQFGGVRKAGGFSVISGGAKIEQLSLKPKDMAFTKGRQATREEIAAVFGVPLSKLTVESVNRSNAEAGNYQYMTDTILPILRRLEQKINERLLPMYDERLFCAFDNPVPEDKEFVLKQRESNLKTGFMSINEERASEGLEPVEWGNEPIRMLQNTIPESSPPEKSGSKGAVFKRLPPLNHPMKFVDREFEKSLQAFFNLQKKEIIKNFNRDLDVITRDSKASAGDLVSGWFDVHKWNIELERYTMPFVRATFLAGGERALRQFIKDRRFDTNNPQALNAMTYRAGRLVEINATTVRRLRNEVASGLESGEGAVKIRKRINGLFDNSFTKHRAETIARTETIWAHNEGVMQGYKQTGIVTKKEWVTSIDDRNCDYCAQMDGRIVGIDVDYQQTGGVMVDRMTGQELHFAYENVEHPPLHPKCRCTIVAVVE